MTANKKHGAIKATRNARNSKSKKNSSHSQEKNSCGEYSLHALHPWGLAGNDNIAAFLETLSTDGKKCYQFFNKKEFSQHRRLLDPIPTFLFVRKEGIHYVFKEIRAGYFQTMTREQFINKKIVEVSIND